MTTELTKAAMKPHQIAQLVNKLRDIAREFHAHDCLRELISQEVNSTLTQRPAAQSEAQALAHNMMLWREDAVHNGNEYVPVHVRTLEKVIAQLRDMPAPQQATPASAEDMAVYDGIAAGYFTDTQQATPAQDAENAGLVSANGHLSMLLNESTQMLAQLREMVDALHDTWSNGGRPERGEFPLLDRVDDWLNARPPEMLTPQQATPEPVQADSSEHLRVIASLGAALRRLSFAAQTSGGTAGPDAELQAAIGQAEQALSFGGIAQAMFATPPQQAAGEPVEEVVYIAKGHLREVLNGNTMNAYLSPEPDRFADVALFTRPAPGVPELTGEMVNAAHEYLNRFKHWPGLPDQFRWHELWSTMLAAAQAKGDAHD